MSIKTQPSTAPESTLVEMEHWQTDRLPKGHLLHERWSITWHGQTLLTFGTESEARAAAAVHGWQIRESMRGAA